LTSRGRGQGGRRSAEIEQARGRKGRREFVRLVNAGGVACTVRDTRGQEIAAACGQLAAEG
jgi:adenine C2-methylase RlmN of 23S rRNA A2503 and tRNA A37